MKRLPILLPEPSLNRRNLVKCLLAAGVIGLAGSGRALGASPAFRMSEQDAIMFLALQFTQKFLPPDIEWQSLSFSTSGFTRTAAFARGAVDGFSTAWSYLAAFTAEGVPGTAVCGIAAGGNRLLAAKGQTKVNSITDLKGKKIGIIKFSNPDIMLIAALRKAGLDPFKDVERVDMGSTAGMIAAMARGDIDACAIFEPQASIIMIQHGGRHLTDLAEESFGYSTGGLYIRKEFIQAHPDIVQAIVNATVKASEFIAKNPDEWIKRGMEITGQSKDVIAAAIANGKPDVNMPLKTILPLTKALYELGIRDKDYSEQVRQNIDYSFLMKATGSSKEALGYV
jgi:ABC-type nitrate/sulfonate/bicarbonate transport system substrate-binding protein